MRKKKLQPGDTRLIEISPNIFVKNESENPFGTIKDRRSYDIVTFARSQNIQAICLITSGNAGYSLVSFAKASNLKVYCIVDSKINSNILSALRTVSTGVVEVELEKKILTSKEIEQLVKRAFKLNNQPYDVTNGFHFAYGSIVRELEDFQPDILVCPYGSGETYHGLVQELTKRRINCKVIGVKPKASQSMADKLCNIWSPYDNLKANPKHQIITLAEREISKAYNNFRKIVDCEPSAAVVYGALPKLGIKKNQRVVLLNSGRGLMNT